MFIVRIMGLYSINMKFIVSVRYVNQSKQNFLIKKGVDQSETSKIVFNIQLRWYGTSPYYDVLRIKKKPKKSSIIL